MAKNIFTGKKIRRAFILLCMLSLFIGCASTPEFPHKETNSSISLDNPIEVKKHLNIQFKQWKNVKYKLGGLSKSGVDCSGFVYLTFRSKFGIQLPRTTTQQAKSGGFVKQRHLKIGDLVFFKTSWRVRHVGIYMGARKFLHASTSRGVMISTLDEKYWRKRYWKAVRVRS